MGLENFYHGSIYEFDSIDIRAGKPYKDFGPGFYTTKRKEHAKAIARRNNRYAGGGHPEFVYTYKFNEQWFKQFNTLVFKEADVNWIDFILMNRHSPCKLHDFDIIKGPTADDNTRICLSAYSNGLYGEVGSMQAKLMLLQNLETSTLPTQIYFGSIEVADILNNGFVGRR